MHPPGLERNPFHPATDHPEPDLSLNSLAIWAGRVLIVWLI